MPKDALRSLDKPKLEALLADVEHRDVGVTREPRFGYELACFAIG